MAKKILIVDDEPGILKSLSIRLEAHKYQVITAEDGREALEKVGSENPDLVILDVMMPAPNGFQVCRELKDSNETKEIPVILLTAKAGDSDKFWGGESGAEAYVTKPHNSDELLEKVRELLGE